VIRWVVVIVLCAGGLAWAARGAMQASRDAQRSRTELRAAQSQAEELVALRAAVPSDRKPGSGLAARVSGVLSQSGLPPSALSSLSPESAMSAGSGFRRQHATLVLAGTTLPQIGTFLQHWRTAEPAWVIASVELNPAPPQNPAPGADLPLRCTIGLEAVYIEATGDKP
jgi:hypothetical protein